MSRRSQSREWTVAYLLAGVLIAGCASPRPAPVPVGVVGLASLAASPVDSLTPTLTWPAMTAPAGTARVTYELRVWRLEGGYPAELVYMRAGLPEPRHTLSTPLRPGTEYAWASRTRLEVEGHVRLTDWRAPQGTRFGVLPNPLYSRFTTPGG